MTEENLDLLKIAEIREKVKDLNVDKLFSAFIGMLKAYSEMAIRIGTIQRDNQDAFESLVYLGSIAPQFLKAISKKTPPQEFGAFIQAFMDLLEISSKLDQLMTLPAEEKIEIGRKLEKIAHTLEEMVIRAKEAKAEQPPQEGNV